MTKITPKPRKKTTTAMVCVRLSTGMIAEIDAKAEGWDDTRSRALRRLIQVGLDHDGCDGG